MRTSSLWLALSLLAVSALMPHSVFAKDDPISLEQCPAPVRAVVHHHAKNARLEVIALDKKSKSGGPPVYEAKFAAQNGERFELHISPEGKIVEVEKKKRKLQGPA